MFRIATDPDGGRGSGKGKLPVVFNSVTGQWRSCATLTIRKIIDARDPHKVVGNAWAGGKDHPFSQSIGTSLDPGTVRLGKLMGLDQLTGVGLGVLYDQSCRMRVAEAAAGANLYAKKFWDEFPERFLKFLAGMGFMTVPPGGMMGLPELAKRIVSEMEVAVVPTKFCRPALFALTNDGTDSGYEGANIINLPVAKSYAGCFSGGPWWTCFSPDELPNGSLPMDLSMKLTVGRGDKPDWFTGEASWAQMSRPLDHLLLAVAYWLGQHFFKAGLCIQTGTGVIMGSNGHEPGDQITMASNYLGTYRTGVEFVPTWRPEGVSSTFQVSDLDARFKMQA